MCSQMRCIMDTGILHQVDQAEVTDRLRMLFNYRVVFFWLRDAADHLYTRSALPILVYCRQRGHRGNSDPEPQHNIRVDLDSIFE